jgi:hypothetical protein
MGFECGQKLEVSFRQRLRQVKNIGENFQNVNWGPLYPESAKAHLGFSGIFQEFFGHSWLYSEIL